jgi:hypothetical protein
MARVSDCNQDTRFSFPEKNNWRQTPMNTHEQAELIALLKSLHPLDRADVLRFIHVRQLARIANRRPPSAYEWESLMEWQRTYLYLLFRFHLAKQQAAQYIRSLLTKQV